jgi:hypothetical protein
VEDVVPPEIGAELGVVLRDDRFVADADQLAGLRRLDYLTPELARKAFVTPQSMNEVLKQLEISGLVERHQSRAGDTTNGSDGI